MQERLLFFVGDLFQLPPVKAPNIFSAYNSVFGGIFHLWDLLKMSELTEVMKQQGESLFTNILNAARIGELSDKDAEVLDCRKGDVKPVLSEAKVIFAENSPNDS